MTMARRTERTTLHLLIMRPVISIRFYSVALAWRDPIALTVHEYRIQ
jgi:hypothetical protein